DDVDLGSAGGTTGDHGGRSSNEGEEDTVEGRDTSTVEKRMASRDAIHPLKRKRSRSRSDEKVSLWQDFGTYQICLLFATQFSYMPIAASILCTSFMKMTTEGCSLVLAARNGTAGPAGANETTTASPTWYRGTGTVPEGEFHSLFTLWGLDCTEGAQTIQTWLSTAIMVGGLVGALISGFVADRFGRKPVVIASLVVVSLGNGLLLLSSLLSWPLTLPIFVVIGGACGGYMTTNLVLVVESLCLPSSRLLVVALNGWSLSMAGTALLAFMCPNWFQYHLAVAIISSICALGLYFIADESLLWLKSSHKVTRFDRASERLIQFNGGEGCKDIALLCQLEKDEAAAPARPLAARETDESGGQTVRAAPSMTYIDLFNEGSLRPHLLSLVYCFFSSSVVSFGCYFAIDSLSGNRYANLAMAGIGKFGLGLLPFAVSSCVSRKQVALVSVAAAAIATWVVLACLLAGLPFQSVAITVLSLVATAALDPTWKISHLYSTELFPTSMRNMARGLCNSAGRIGSSLAPGITHLRHETPGVTYGMFALLLTAQLVITAVFLPKQLPSELQDSVPGPLISAEKKKKAKRSEFDDQEEEVGSRDDSSQLSETAPLTP
ncbi:hypothetical protein PENTCL1PPCAC_27796, partial [Pristionchus entomophagus]